MEKRHYTRMGKGNERKPGQDQDKEPGREYTPDSVQDTCLKSKSAGDLQIRHGATSIEAIFSRN